MMSRIRLGSWGLLIVCFFLPFARGCESVPITPYKEAFSHDASDFLGYVLPFLYPLLLWGMCQGLRLIRDEHVKMLVAKLLYGAYVCSLTLLAIFFIKELSTDPSPDRWLAGSLLVTPAVILLGITAMGFKRLHPERIFMLMAFGCAVLSWGWISYWFLAMSSDRLIGSWLSFFASTVIVVTYLVDYVRSRQRLTKVTA